MYAPQAAAAPYIISTRWIHSEWAADVDSLREHPLSAGAEELWLDRLLRLKRMDWIAYKRTLCELSLDGGPNGDEWKLYFTGNGDLISTCRHQLAGLYAWCGRAVCVLGMG